MSTKDLELKEFEPKTLDKLRRDAGGQAEHRHSFGHIRQALEQAPQPPPTYDDAWQARYTEWYYRTRRDALGDKPALPLG